MGIDNDTNILVEGLKELRATVESKQADTAEAKAKIDAITKDLGDVQAKQQVNFEEKAAEKAALEAEISLVKEDLLRLKLVLVLLMIQVMFVKNILLN